MGLLFAHDNFAAFHGDISHLVLVGHDDGGNGGQACRTDGIDIKLQQKLALFDGVAGLYMSGEGGAVEADGLQADMSRITESPMPKSSAWEARLLPSAHLS